ncbi:MAG: GNAT family N-acetyltransferase [Candidatus Omnitrophica bacterium]|nr:GNAT family N-acetyltransferase [Candidatus Omnitrophota bacterium]
MPGEVEIRKFQAKDKAAVRQIAYATALMGESAGLFFQGQEVISDALSLYFTDYEPGSCFVAWINDQIVGYLIGAKNKIAAEAIFNRQIVLPVFFKALKSGIFLRKKNLILIFSCLKDLLINGIKTPDFNRAYPATFHLNIKADFRRQDIGAKLINAYLDYLKFEGVFGVHLATMSDQAANFFLSQGFGQLYKGKRSYFRHILHRDVPLYIFGKRL